jgi:hypothetical protein
LPSLPTTSGCGKYDLAANVYLHDINLHH